MAFTLVKEAYNESRPLRIALLLAFLVRLDILQLVQV